jgi:hypothetical protein
LSGIVTSAEKIKEIKILRLTEQSSFGIQIHGPDPDPDPKFLIDQNIEKFYSMENRKNLLRPP